MKVLYAVFFGIIQGLTEFLPVSSSGHLAILQSFFNSGDVEKEHFTFSILLHLGTLVAVCIVYYKDILPLFPAFFKLIGRLFTGKFKFSALSAPERFVLFVIIATLPLVCVVFLSDYVEVLSGMTKVIGGILIFNGVVLFISDFLSHGNDNEVTAKPWSALVVGLCQVCAILPGLSRSGSTITGGLLCGYKREYAVKFSFILSIPAILGANILEIPKIADNPVSSEWILPYIIGTVVAAVTGICAMKLLIFISKKFNFRMFSYYCIAVGILTVIFG